MFSCSVAKKIRMRDISWKKKNEREQNRGFIALTLSEREW